MSEETYLLRLRRLIASNIERAYVEGCAEGTCVAAPYCTTMADIEVDMEEYLATITMIRSREATALWTEAAGREWDGATSVDAGE